jgi:hypothetical protein
MFVAGATTGDPRTTVRIVDYLQHWHDFYNRPKMTHTDTIGPDYDVRLIYLASLAY